MLLQKLHLQIISLPIYLDVLESNDLALCAKLFSILVKHAVHSHSQNGF